MTPAPENPAAFPRYYLVFDVESIGLHAAGFEWGRKLGDAGCLILIAALLTVSTAALVTIWKDKL